MIFIFTTGPILETMWIIQLSEGLLLNSIMSSWTRTTSVINLVLMVNLRYCLIKLKGEEVTHIFCLLYIRNDYIKISVWYIYWSSCPVIKEIICSSIFNLMNMITSPCPCKNLFLIYAYLLLLKNKTHLFWHMMADIGIKYILLSILIILVKFIKAI